MSYIFLRQKLDDAARDWLRHATAEQVHEFLRPARLADLCSRRELDRLARSLRRAPLCGLARIDDGDAHFASAWRQSTDPARLRLCESLSGSLMRACAPLFDDPARCESADAEVQLAVGTLLDDPECVLPQVRLAGRLLSLLARVRLTPGPLNDRIGWKLARALAQFNAAGERVRATSTKLADYNQARIVSPEEQTRMRARFEELRRDGIKPTQIYRQIGDEFHRAVSTVRAKLPTRARRGRPKGNRTEK